MSVRLPVPVVIVFILLTSNLKFTVILVRSNGRVLLATACVNSDTTCNSFSLMRCCDFVFHNLLGFRSLITVISPYTDIRSPRDVFLCRSTTLRVCKARVSAFTCSMPCGDRRVIPHHLSYCMYLYKVHVHVDWCINCV